MSDKRTDSGQFYPGGKVIVHPEEAPPQTTVAWNDVTGKPSAFPPSEHVHTKSQITDFPNFKTINGENIVGTGNIEISGGWSYSGDESFSDDKVIINLRNGLRVFNFQSGSFGFVGELIIPTGLTNLEFLITGDMTFQGAFFMLEDATYTKRLVCLNTGSSWSGYVTLNELMSNVFPSGIPNGYSLIKLRGVGEDILVEVN